MKKESAAYKNLKETATNMRNMKLINKIKKSGVVKQGSMKKTEANRLSKGIDAMKKAGNAKADAEAKDRKASKKTTNEVLDTPQAMNSYKSKAKTNLNKAKNSFGAAVMRGDKDDYYKSQKTMSKRDKGLKMADRNATKKTFKNLRDK